MKNAALIVGSLRPRSACRGYDPHGTRIIRMDLPLTTSRTAYPAKSSPW
jgi:hypothetical protein